MIKIRDLENGDLRLRTGSPAIGAGTALDGLTNDIDQARRPKGKAPDLGPSREQRAAPDPQDHPSAPE